MSPQTISLGSSVAAYSHAKVHAGLVFTSGLTPHSVETGHIQGTTIEEQTELSLALAKDILAAAGSSLDDVLQVHVFLNDIEGDYSGFDATYKSLMPAPYPPRATVEAHLPGYRIEMTIIAAVSEKD